MTVIEPIEGMGARRTGRTTRIVETLPETVAPGQRIRFVIPWPGIAEHIKPLIRRHRPKLEMRQIEFVTIQTTMDCWKLDGRPRDEIFADHTVFEFAEPVAADYVRAMMGERE